MKKLESISWIVLFVSISFTLLIWIGYSYSLTQSQYSSFLDNADSVTLSISDELEHYEQILIGIMGLYASSEKVQLDEYRAFIDLHQIDKRYPGLQGIGYAQHTVHEDKIKLISLMNGYGVENFDIKPSGDRDEYYPILFIEPSDVRNAQAVGYDIYFEQTRHDAVNTVKETGTTTITGKIILVQEIDENIQNGFLMMDPIYSNDDSSLQGIVYAVFRINDFVQATINMETFEHHRLKIYDEYVSDETLFFDSELIHDSKFDTADYSTTITSSINNRNWVFVFEGVKTPFDQISTLILFFIPIVGFSMSFLLFYVFNIIAKNLKLTQDVLRSEKISAMGIMASRLSHDLRNPLTVIKNTLQLMKMNFGSNIDEKTEKFSKRIEDSVDSMSNIIEDVLQFSKTSELKKEAISFNQTIQNVISNIDVPSRIKISLPEDDHIIFCDKNKMKSVFSNLITNSIQSIKDDGSIFIRVEDTPTHLIISFEDSGPGIPKDKLNQIFDPLFTTKPTGTGLGLGICKSIVEGHGGKITVKNAPTTFSISLPKNS